MRLCADIVSDNTVVSRVTASIAREDNTLLAAQKTAECMRKELEKLVQSGVYGPDAKVEVYTDGAYALLFWYLLLHRPWNTGVIRDGFFVDSPGCLLDALRNDENSKQLRLTNLGVLYDKDNNWLTLSLSRAQQSGLLSGWDSCPAWIALAKRLQAQRPEKGGALDHVTYQRQMARYSSFVVPPKTLRQFDYAKRLSAFQGIGEKKPQLDDLVVFDCAALPLIEAEVQANRWVEQNELGKPLRSVLPATLDLYVVRFTPEDPEEAKRMRKAARKSSQERWQQTYKLRRRESRGIGSTGVPRSKAPWMEAKQDWHNKASSIISQLFRAYNLKRGMVGKRHYHLTGTEVRMAYEELLGAYKRAEYIRLSSNKQGDTAQVGILLSRLQECCENDSTLPKEYNLWLQLQNMSLDEALCLYDV